MNTDNGLVELQSRLDETAKVELPGAPEREETKLIIEPGDTLVVEYVKMPIMDLNYRFIWRFRKPLATAWMPGEIGVLAILNVQTSMANATPKDAYYECLNRYFLDNWRFNIANGGSVPPGCEWMAGVYKVELHECEIVRKAVPEDAELII